MKDLLFKDVTIINYTGIKKHQNIRVNNKRISFVSDLSKTEDFAIINCENKIALPSLPLFKKTILDVFSYKYLNKMDSSFILDKEAFEKIPFNIIEITSDAIAKRMALSGNNILFYSHIAYQMVKNSLLTISNNLYSKEKIKSSLSYFYNNLEPEQEILSQKENDDFKNYVGNKKEYFRNYHLAVRIDERTSLEKLQCERVAHLYVARGFEQKALDLCKKNDEDVYLLLDFEDPNVLKNWERKWNHFFLINEDYFKNRDFASFIFETLGKEEDFPFILSAGYNVYNIYRSFANILKYTDDVRTKNLIINQMQNLSKVSELFTLEKFGKIEDFYYADFILMDMFDYNIESIDNFIDYLFVIYFDLLKPETVVFDGKIKK